MREASADCAPSTLFGDPLGHPVSPGAWDSQRTEGCSLDRRGAGATPPSRSGKQISPQALGSVKTAADGAFGWGGTPVIWQHWCPEVELSVNRNHAQEEKAKSSIDDEILGENPTRESEAYRSFAYLAIGFQTARIQR